MSEYVIAPKGKMTAIADKIRNGNETMSLDDIIEKISNNIPMIIIIGYYDLEDNVNFISNTTFEKAQNIIIQNSPMDIILQEVVTIEDKIIYTMGHIRQLRYTNNPPKIEMKFSESGSVLTWYATGEFISE